MRPYAKILGMAALTAAICLAVAVFVSQNTMSTVTSAMEYNSSPLISVEPPAAYLGQSSAAKAEILAVAGAEAGKHEYTDRYNCDEFSRDVRVAIINTVNDTDVQYRIKVVNCSYSYWDAGSCQRYGGLHKFLYVKHKGEEPFYIEANQGTEVTPDMYPMYNIREGLA